MRGKTCRNAAFDKPHDRAAIARAVHRPEDGATLVLTAILLVILFAIGYVGVNWAVAVAARVSAQRAADAAALAGCLDLPDKEKAIASARKYGTSAGGLNANTSFNLESGQGDQVLLDPPPGRSAIVDSDNTKSVRTDQPLENNRITVHVRRTQWLFGIPNWPPLDRIMPVEARAVCVRNEGGMAVLHALYQGSANKYPEGTLKVDGSDLDIPRGGIIVNSADPTAMRALGNSQINARYVETGSGTVQLTGSSAVNPPPYEGWEPDPFRNVPEPTLGGSIDLAPYSLPIPPRGQAAPMPGCSYPRGRQPTREDPQPCTITQGTAQPGVYWGGLQLGDGTPRTITLSPGLYYMAGGGFTVEANTTVIGDGVIIFNGRNWYPNQKSQRDCQSVWIKENATLSLTPPQSGLYRDLLVFQARTPAPSSPPGATGQEPDCDAELKTEAGVTIGRPAGPYGVLYLPNALANIGPQSLGSGSARLNMNVIVIAEAIRVRGPVNFADIYIPSGDVKHGDIHLVE
jgi:hypothetical protein